MSSEALQYKTQIELTGKMYEDIVISRQTSCRARIQLFEGRVKTWFGEESTCSRRSLSFNGVTLTPLRHHYETREFFVFYLNRISMGKLSYLDFQQGGSRTEATKWAQILIPRARFEWISENLRLYVCIRVLNPFFFEFGTNLYFENGLNKFVVQKDPLILDHLLGDGFPKI